MGVGIPPSSLPVDVEVSATETVSEIEVMFKPRTTGGRPDTPPEAASDSVDVPARPG